MIQRIQTGCQHLISRALVNVAVVQRQMPGTRGLSEGRFVPLKLLKLPSPCCCLDLMNKTKSRNSTEYRRTSCSSSNIAVQTVLKSEDYVQQRRCYCWWGVLSLLWGTGLFVSMSLPLWPAGQKITLLNPPSICLIHLYMPYQRNCGDRYIKTACQVFTETFQPLHNHKKFVEIC